MDDGASSAPRTVNGYQHGRVPRAVRREQLLALAEDLFTEKGFDGFAIDDLCRSAGVSRPIIYEHFGSKDGIYIACLSRIREEFEHALVAAAIDSHDLASTAHACAEAWFSILEREPQRWSLVYGGATGLVGPLAAQLGDLRDATVEQIRMIGRRFAPRASEEEMVQWAHAVSGAGEQLGRWWLRNAGVPRERVVAFYSDFVVSGVEHLAAAAAT